MFFSPALIHASLCGNIFWSANSHFYSVNTADAVLCASALPALFGMAEGVANRQNVGTGALAQNLPHN
jgi:hypothetical protein